MWWLTVDLVFVMCQSSRCGVAHLQCIFLQCILVDKCSLLVHYRTHQLELKVFCIVKIYTPTILHSDITLLITQAHTGHAGACIFLQQPKAGIHSVQFVDEFW